VSEIARRLPEVRARIEAACRRASRDPASVTLVAVSKTFPAEAVREAHALGLREFGENRAQSLRDKAKALADLDDLVWHFIGPIQTNKVRYLVGTAALVHAVDREEVARALSERAEREGAEKVRCLVAVHLGGEATKSGVEPDDAEALLGHLADMPGLDVRGLFTIPPPADDPEDTRPHFAALRTLAETLRERTSLPLPELSMGMSHDLEVAIEEGATIVRVGTALFGPREVETT